MNRSCVSGKIVGVRRKRQPMSIDLTFKQVCEFLKKDDPTLTDSVDRVLAFAIVCSPIVLGPGALPSWLSCL